MKKRIEIEAKFELLNVKELLKILERLEKYNNAKLVEKDEMQKDTYFTPNDRKTNRTLNRKRKIDYTLPVQISI